MSALAVFDFEERPVRMVMIEGEPWFVGKDVCDALGHKNSRDALSRLDDDERADVGIADVSSDGVRQDRKFTIISEAGVYQLIFTSRVEAAKRFKRWLAHEVIPSIRKTGSYRAPQATVLSPERMAILNKAIAAMQAAPDDAFQFDVYMGGHLPKFWPDFEVRQLVLSLLGQTTQKEIIIITSAVFGPERAPSKSALNRFAMLIRGIRRAAHIGRPFVQTRPDKKIKLVPRNAA